MFRIKNIYTTHINFVRKKIKPIQVTENEQKLFSSIK